MTYRLFLFIMAAGVCGSTPYAASADLTTVDNHWSWLTSLSAGTIWAKGGQSQTFFLTPDIEKTYVARKCTQAIATGELFIGLQKSWSSLWQGQLGLATSTSSNAKLQGMIWDDADPRFNNHHYQYNIHSNRIAVKGKLLFNNQHLLIPWIATSLGISFNRADDFTNTPLILEALPNANFKSHTKSSFSYTLSTGIQKTLNLHWQIGVGYEFADWGKSQLSNALDQTTPARLSLNHFYSNGVLFNLTYLA